MEMYGCLRVYLFIWMDYKNGYSLHSSTPFFFWFWCSDAECGVNPFIRVLFCTLLYDYATYWFYVLFFFIPPFSFSLSLSLSISLSLSRSFLHALPVEWILNIAPHLQAQ